MVCIWARKFEFKALIAALPVYDGETLESVLIEPQQTTVYLSGNSPGLDAVVNAVRSNFSDAKVAKARHHESGKR
jgi:hypothetical protein